MDAQAIISISAAVVALTQLVKWGKLPDKYGPLSVLLLSVLGIGLWRVSYPSATSTLFDAFVAWIAVSTSAAGVFGFTRASGVDLTKMIAPPPGAGADRTKHRPSKKKDE